MEKQTMKIGEVANILTDPQVRQALKRYQLLKVDTDEYVKPSNRFEVVGLPTLLVLDVNGVEIYRHIGMIDAETLASKLALFASDKE